MSNVTFWKIHLNVLTATELSFGESMPGEPHKKQAVPISSIILQNSIFTQQKT
jgi:hypothetical protein